MIVTDATARDPYVGRLVASGALKYTGSAPVVPRPEGPKLIDRSVPEPEQARAEPVSASETEPDKAFRHTKKNKDK
jgi:hypothetical protein